MQTMIVKAIVKLYFFAALAVSFSHIVCASHKVQLDGWQAWTTPFAIDGIAVIGMVMRTERWTKRTNTIGFRVQLIAGLLSLACNVFAGNTVGERIYGVIIVALFIFTEWLSDQLVTRKAEEARAEAEAQAAAVAQAEAEAAEAERIAQEAAEAKRVARRTAERNRRAARKAEEKSMAKAHKVLAEV